MFAARLVTAFGLLWLAFEPLSLFFPGELEWGWWGYVTLLLVSVAYAFYASWPRNSVQRSLPPSDLTVAIEVGDVLAQEGNVVVGVADTFDTQFEDSVISPNSVQGQLLARTFAGDRLALDAAIAKALTGIEGDVDSAKAFGKERRYPIGTVAFIPRGNSRYFLVAFTQMSGQLPAVVSSTIESLQIALARTWELLARAGQREAVHLPILGSNLARLGVTRTLLIQMIVLSFIAAEKRGHVVASLTIWVSEADAHVVDMAALDEWLRALCAS